MAITNRERVGSAMDALKDGLAPFASREFINQHKGRSAPVLQQILGDAIQDAKQHFFKMDTAALLRVMWDSWNEVYRDTLGNAERSLVSELRDIRNRWAHQEQFSSDDAYRALDSTHRLLTAVSAPEAGTVENMKMELLRVRFDEQARSQRRRTSGAAIESQAAGILPAWRDVVNPHRDVASGQYQQAEFAADLWQVHLGEGVPEYRDPSEFFRRTYLTDSLTRMLRGAMERLAGAGGDPVVQLQTNFGGGKTHSLLALYHLFSGIPVSELSGMDAVMQDTGVVELPKVNRVVLVGNRISPGNPATKPDGTEVRTLWGELAWQLGLAAGGQTEARRAYERVQADDQRATNPGDALRSLMNDYGPCLILIDEWVAYARQLPDEGDLPAGSFETQFTFAQALTESAKLANHCLLVISLPASEAPVSPQAQADDIEVGGRRGREALNRLSNVIGRIETPWRPASAEESFEIVRRRLFETIVDPASFAIRDNVARAFCDLYRTNHQEFPPECLEPGYEKRIIDAYPIHPEVFERLYTDWSTLQNFQRTRGVLRLMAAVVHCLWEKGDRNPLILPANVPIDDSRVQFELTQYLPENWTPVIERDIDGANSLPIRLDGELPNLGKHSACRRVARSIYMGSAPIPTAANQGIEDRRIKLGCVIPGEPVAVFGDAMRRLGSAATYLYQDGARYWYSTQPTVANLAESRTEEYRRNRDKVDQEIERRLRADLSSRGDFNRVHVFPSSQNDVQDDREARLVVLGPDASHTREGSSESRAMVVAKSILESRGSAPRLFRNTLVFLVADDTRLQELEDGVRRYLAWQSILADKESLDLPPHQVRQAESQQTTADSAVAARIGETYQWLLVPGQSNPHAPVEWHAIRLTGQGHLAERASRKMRSDELLVTSFGGTRLRMELDRVPLWRGNHVPVRQLLDDFARYIYLPRLKDPSVLLGAISNGLALMTWEQDSFAYADEYDEPEGRYRGLQHGPRPMLSDSDPGLIVRPDMARNQLDAETVSSGVANQETPIPYDQQPGQVGHLREPSSEERQVDGGAGSNVRPLAKRYHGSVKLDPTRVGRDAGTIAEEVVAHLAGLMGTEVRLTLEIEANIPGGAPEQVVRVVTENSRTLKFDDSGFESE
ncbi:MAG: Swt1 family HEPN domain-containing protein [Chloroflexi bacterium]|nr:Swt1 family HEPN domain-containing protein [Chloroflexota bacterium]